MLKIIFVVIALLIFFVGSFFIPVSYGDSTIYVKTDKLSYSESDSIQVIGGVNWWYPDDTVTIAIFDPNNNLVRIAQTKLINDGSTSTVNHSSFSYIFSNLQDLGGQGQYIVTVDYYVSGHGSYSAQTSFSFSGGTLTKIYDTNIEIKHSSFNGKLTKIIADVPSKSLTFLLQSNEDGVIAIELPRNVLSASLGDTDIDFDVKVDGIDSSYKEKDTQSSRILMIGFSKSTSVIKITGTNLDLTSALPPPSIPTSSPQPSIPMPSSPILTTGDKVEGTNYSIKDNVTNGKILGIKADTQSKSLIVSMQTTGNGVLTTTLPRGLIDAILPSGQDDKYYVLLDGKETDFQETSTTTADRTLSIPFTDGTEEMEIIGTQIVPEFPFATFTLVIAIFSIIFIPTIKKIL